VKKKDKGEIETRGKRKKKAFVQKNLFYGFAIIILPFV